MTTYGPLSFDGFDARTSALSRITSDGPTHSPTSPGYRQPAKTSDQILESIARYCQRINASAH